MVRSTVTTMERGMDALERRMNEFRAELRNQRDDFRRWLERLERHSRRRRGRSRRPHPREENGETVEPATVKKPIAMRKSEKVEEKMEKNLGNLKLQFSDVAESVKHVDDEDRKTEQQKIEKEEKGMVEIEERIFMEGMLEKQERTRVWENKVEATDNRPPTPLMLPPLSPPPQLPLSLSLPSRLLLPPLLQPPPLLPLPPPPSKPPDTVAAIGALTEEKFVGKFLTLGFLNDGRKEKEGGGALLELQKICT